MSGNNNSDHDTAIGGGGSDTTPNCATLSGRGTIMSPVASVLATLKVGDTLTISLRAATGPVQAFTIAGQLVGSVLLSSTFSTSIIYCINEQFEYQGRIISLVGGSCELVISAR